jgi:hypothetical protein
MWPYIENLYFYSLAICFVLCVHCKVLPMVVDVSCFNLLNVKVT